MLPALATKANTALRAAQNARASASTTVAPKDMPADTTGTRAARPVGVLTGLLTRLGRRMHCLRDADPAPTAPTATASSLFGMPATPTPTPRTAPMMSPRSFEDTMAPALAAFDAMLDARAQVAPAGTPRPSGSLFDRTLADAQRSHRSNMPAPGFEDDAPMFASTPVFTAAALRARTGYGQSAPDDEALAREERIGELQRAITAARRNAG